MGAVRASKPIPSRFGYGIRSSDSVWAFLFFLLIGGPIGFVLIILLSALFPQKRDATLKKTLSQSGFLVKRGTLLQYFPFSRSEAKDAQTFSILLEGSRGNHELLVFDYQGKGSGVQTIVAVRGEAPDRILPLLGEYQSRASVVENWLIYATAGKGSVEEIREVVACIPYEPDHKRDES